MGHISVVRRIPAIGRGARLGALLLGFFATPWTNAQTPARQAPTRPAARAEPEAAPAVAEAAPETPPPAEIPATEPATPAPTGPVPEAKPETKPEVAPVPPSTPPTAPKMAMPPPPPKRSSPPPPELEIPPVPAKTNLEVQIELSRRGFSTGSIDGAMGPKTRAAIRAFQESQLLVATGDLDAETRAKLQMTSPPLVQRALSVAELAALQPISPTWLGKSQQTSLAHETALEAIAEKFHAHPLQIKKLNPTVDWAAPVTAETLFTVPNVERVEFPTRASRLEIKLADCTLEAFDANDRVMAHFPVSIGRLAESRPVGELKVTVVIPDPNYTFDPAVYPESPEAQELGRKLILQPGPNNPVGVAWVGLNRPGYGIHGTPSPERVGAAESHGCFRLANYDARTLLALAWSGMPVLVISPEPK